MPGKDWTVYFSGLDKAGYLDLLNRTIVGPDQSDAVVLRDASGLEHKANVVFVITVSFVSIGH